MEVAVGTGILFQQVLKANPTVRNEGIHLSEELARAKIRAERSGTSNYALKVGDAYHLEYPDGSFDVLLNNYMFDLIPEKDFLQILKEFKRVLRPGRRIVLANMTAGKPWFNSIWHWLYKADPAFVGGCRGVELSPYLQRIGFENIRREYISEFTFPSEVIYALKPTQPPSVT